VMVSPGVTIFEVGFVRRARLAGLLSSSSSIDSSEESLLDAAGEPYSGLSSPIVGERIVMAMAVVIFQLRFHGRYLFDSSRV
jgi:hypothetical protein